MTVDLCMPYVDDDDDDDTFMLVLMTLTLMQGHSGSAKAKISVACSRQLKLGTAVGHFYVTLTLILQTFI